MSSRKRKHSTKAIEQSKKTKLDSTIAFDGDDESTHPSERESHGYSSKESYMSLYLITPHSPPSCRAHAWMLLPSQPHSKSLDIADIAQSRVSYETSEQTVSGENIVDEADSGGLSSPDEVTLKRLEASERARKFRRKIQLVSRVEGFPSPTTGHLDGVLRYRSRKRAATASSGYSHPEMSIPSGDGETCDESNNADEENDSEEEGEGEGDVLSSSDDDFVPDADACHSEDDNSDHLGKRFKRASRHALVGLSKAKGTLRIRRSDMKALLKEKLKFPYHPRALVRKKKSRATESAASGDSSEWEGSNGTNVIKGLRRKIIGVDASNVTPQQMTEAAQWIFRPEGKRALQDKHMHITVVQMYQPLKIDTEKPKDYIFEPPIDITRTEPLDPQEKVHIRIGYGLTRLKHEFERSEFKYKIPAELLMWDEPSGFRPGLPKEYAQFLERTEELERPRHGSPALTQFDATPSPQKRLNTGRGNKVCSPFDPIAEDDSAPVGNPNHSAGSFIEEAPEVVTETAVHVKTLMEPLVDTTLADEFIKKRGFKPSLLTARSVAKHIEKEQEVYDRKWDRYNLTHLILQMVSAAVPNTSPGKEKIAPVPKSLLETEAYTHPNCMLRMGGIHIIPKSRPSKEPVQSYQGDPTLYEISINQRQISPRHAVRWLRFTGMAQVTSTDAKNPSDLAEIDIEKEVGRLFLGIFDSEKLLQTSGKGLHSSRDLRLFDTDPHPDLAARARGEIWRNWGHRLLTYLVGGDCKNALRPKSEQENWEAQLAMSVGPILNILALMHLDTRETPTSPMPAWMFVFGILYTQLGYTIYGYYPSLKHHPATELGEQAKPGSWNWNHVSLKLSSRYKDIYTAGSSSARRAQTLQIVDFIVWHTNFVLAQIERWATLRGQFPGGVLDQIIARARYDDRKYNWVIQKAEGYEGPY